MATPLTIRFATDVDGAKKGIADLAALVVSNADRIGGAVKAVATNSAVISDVLGEVGRHASDFRGLADEAGGFGAAMRSVAGTVVGDVGAIGSATVKAAGEHNLSIVAMGAAALDAAAKTKTGTKAMDAAWLLSTASIRAKAALLKNEVAGAWT